MSTVVAPAGSAVQGERAFAGTWTLARFILRRDRVRLPVWVLSIAIVVLGSVASFSSTYPTAAERQARADVISGNAAASLFVGPGYGIDHYTFGAMTANELLPLTALVFALMSIFLVVRHTRAEEEAERADLVRAAMVGRHAPGTATLIEVIGANLLLCVLLAAGLPATLDGLSAEGSLAFAAAVAGVGIVFAAVALVVAQLTVSARAAIGLASVVMTALYLLRAIADMGGGQLAWLSPFGWATNMRAYVDERWWPIALFLALTAALLVVALRIGARRDVGGGVFAERPGRVHASPRLRSPLALALRLGRTSLVSWGASMLALAAVYGSIAEQASDLSNDVSALQDYYQRVGQGDAIDQYVSFTLFFCAVIACGFVIQAATRPRSEEAAARAEPVLVAPVSRFRWLASHLAVALAGGVAMLVAIGLGMGIAYAVSIGDASQVPRLVGAALIYAPAMWVFAGIAALLFGAVPRATAWTWAALGAVAFLAILGPLLNLPGWMYDVSPFEHTPRLPAAGVSVVPLLVLTAIAAALLAAGALLFRRRDTTGA
jgi:ABC-2 type transport system permease protein